MPDTSFASFLYIFSSLLGFIVLLGIAVVSVFRRGATKTNFLFAGICLLGALLNADVALVYIMSDERIALYLDRTIHFFFVFSIPMYIRFVHEFLKIRNLHRLEKGAWIASALFLTVIPTDLYINGFNHYSFGKIARAGPLFYVFAAFTTFTVFYCLTVLYRAMRRSEDNVVKNRIRYIFGGLGFTTFVLAFTILPVMGVPVYPLGNFSFVPALFLAYGILKYDLLDIGTLIRKGAAYFALTGLLSTLYVLVIFLLNTCFINSLGDNSLIFSLVLALVIVLLFNPLHNLLQRIIDRIFFKGRYDYHKLLKEISGKLVSLLNLDQIRKLLITEIGEAMQVEGVFLVLKSESSYRLFGAGESEKRLDGLIDGIEALGKTLDATGNAMTRGAIAAKSADTQMRETIGTLFDRLGATLVLSLPAREGPVGMIFLGQKKSGELFVDEDIEILATIANQAATAIENAESYEKLERLNVNLENIVEERTRELQKALYDMERAQQQLIQSESLAAIGQLVAGAAHELNNPIAGAMSLVETSVETISEWEVTPEGKGDVIDDLRFSIGELRRSAGIIRSLLDLSRQTQTYVEPVAINQVIEDALRILHNQYKNSPVAIEKHYDPGIPSIEGNFANLGQVMINIITNALQAIPETGGIITLTTAYNKETDTVSVECTDNGAGISPDNMKDIFKPFFTTKGVGRGTGLGLYISHEIIRRHGGTIDVRSREGTGTAVIINLPGKRRNA